MRTRVVESLILVVLIGVLLVASESAGTRGAVPQSKRVAFLIDSWHPWSHADVIGARLLDGYRMGDRTYTSPVGISSVLQIAPRHDHRLNDVASRYGIRIAGSVAEALLDDPRSAQPKLAVDGVLIAIRTPLTTGTPSEPSVQFRLFRETMAVFDRVGSKVPVFLDKNLAQTWEESQAIVAEGTRRGVPMMGGSVLPWVPLEPTTAGLRPQVAVALAAGPYELYAIHVAELLQGVMEQRATRESGVASVRDVGRGLWSLPDRDQWGRDILEALLPRARTPRRPRAPHVPDGLGPETSIVLIQYVDGARGVMALMPRQFDDSEFLLGARGAGQSTPYLGGVVFTPPPDHFGYLVHGLIQFFVSGRPVVPVERTLLTTGISLMGMRSRESGGQGVSASSLAVSYTVPQGPGR